MTRDLYNGQQCHRHLLGIAQEWEERDPTPQDRADIELCKAIALTEIAYNTSIIRDQNRGGGAW